MFESVGNYPNVRVLTQKYSVSGATFNGSNLKLFDVQQAVICTSTEKKKIDIFDHVSNLLFLLVAAIILNCHTDHTLATRWD